MSDELAKSETRDPKSEIYLAALAGLLHDIGKFSQRADVGKREITDAQSLGEVRYVHALHSDSFIRECVPEAWRGELTAPRQHHNPQSDQDYRVQLADWLSASEREDEEDRRVPYLLSPFARLAGHDAAAYLPLARLDPAGGVIFPTQGEPGDWREQYRNEYERLWVEFTRECRTLPQDNLGTYLESLYGLMQEFTWCIPSAYYNSVPDVSLFDHARTTAALAACLAADEEHDGVWCKAVTQKLQAGQKADEEICLLVGGDISGVQAFIYTLASDGAAKSLRARSFYLQMLTEVAARYVLKELDLPITSLLYAGGGIFQIIAPIGADDKLKGIRHDVEKQLLDLHRGALGLTMGWTRIRASEFCGKAFGEVWRCLSRVIRLGKRKPFGNLQDAEIFRAIGESQGLGGEPEKFCHVTGDDDYLNADGDKSLFVESLEELGRQLPRATHLLLARVAATEAHAVTDWHTALQAFGAAVWIMPAGKELVKLPGESSLLRVWRLQPDAPSLPDDLPESLSRLPRVTAYYTFGHLVAQHWNEYKREEHIATFDELAEHSARGIERWGVLRMDVDNLGKLFSEGLDERNTLSRSAALSSALRWFFEGYAPALGRGWNQFASAVKSGLSYQQAWGTDEKPNKRDKLYVQYAGGDDLFVVGAWDALPEYAVRIRERLGEYVCHNPRVTVSAGITLADAHFPLYQAARQAGEAEETAKGFKRPDGREKDAVCFLEQTLGWEQFDRVKERVYSLADWCEKKGMPKSLVQTLLEIAAEYDKPSNKGKIRFGRWMWMLAYHLTRAAARVKDGEVKQGIMDIQEDLLKPDGGIRTIGLAARWTELLIR